MIEREVKQKLDDVLLSNGWWTGEEGTYYSHSLQIIPTLTGLVISNIVHTCDESKHSPYIKTASIAYGDIAEIRTREVNGYVILEITAYGGSCLEIKVKEEEE